MRIRALSIILGLSAAGCDLPSGPENPVDVVLTTNASDYQQGVAVRAVLRNDGDIGIFYNLCRTAGEVHSETGWRRVSPLRLCTADLSVLRPGAEVEFEEPTTSEWAPGLYRMVTTIHVHMQQHDIFSATFEVHP